MVFSYKAVDSTGTVVTGTYNAAEKTQVISYLKAQGMTPVSIGSGVNTDLSAYMPQKKPAAKDLSMFCEQFSALLKAGVTILDGLKLLIEQTKNKALKEAIQTTVTAVNEGESLGNAMAKTPLVFDQTMTSLVKAGEASGSLEASLDRLGSQYKKDAEIAATIKKAMVYPIIVLVVALVVVVFMLMFIVPKVMEIFESVDITMPKITLIVVGAADWLMANWFTALLVTGAVIGLIIAFIKSKTGKKCLSWVALQLPGVKEFTIKSAASKIARTLSTLLTAGMTVLEALVILENTLPNYYYKESIKVIYKKVSEGQQMSKQFLEDTKLYPSMLSHMIAVGEDTGDITSMLSRTADYYDLEVETATETMMSLMQPAIILLLSGIVCVVLAAVLMPMVTLYSELGTAL